MPNHSNAARAPQGGALSRDKVYTETHYRSALVERSAINEEARTVELAFSSEEPVERWFGTEILDHKPPSVRLKRMNGGGAVLVDHDPADHVGTVEEATIDSDRKGRAVVRFGKSARADEIFRDILDGIRKHVSVGYRIHKVEVEDPEAKSPTYRATDWEPLEISIVSIPADASVGVGRNELNLNAGDPPAQQENRIMSDSNLTPTPAPAPVNEAAIRAAGEQHALTRVNEILEIGEKYAKHGGRELASRAIKEGKDAKWLADELLRAMSNVPSPAAPDLGLTSRETVRYSVLRAINALQTKDWSKAPFERECHEALIKRHGDAPNGGFYVPYEVQKRPTLDREQRDLTAGTANAGGYLVATENLSGSFIDMLRARAKVMQLGAFFLPGLQGNVNIPKLTAAATLYWLSTEATAITESQQTFGQLALTPKNAGAYTEISRQLMMQSSPAADMLVMNDLSKVVALGIDLAALNGSGASGQPTGVLNTSGIGAVTGTSLNWPGIVEFETDVSAANADVETMAYLTTPAVRGLLKSRDKTGTTNGNYVWGGQNGEKSLNGYRAEVSTQVPAATMIFGDWSQIIIGEWGVLEIALNPYANFPAGIVGIRAFQTVDIGVRQAGAFSSASSIT